MKKMRKKHSAEFKAKVAIEALRGQETISVLSERYEVSPVMISRWKSEFVSNAAAAFETTKAADAQEKKERELYAKIGKLEMKLDFAKRASKALGIPVPADD